MPKRYTVCDGRIVLTLEPAEEGGYVVSSPLDPAVITQAETVEVTCPHFLDHSL